MVSAWEEVKLEVITRYFKHAGMYPNEAVEIDDPFVVKENTLRRSSRWKLCCS